MIPFKTTPEQLILLEDIAKQLQSYDIEEAINIAKTDQGVFDLLELLVECDIEKEKDEILNDIRKTIKDYNGA